MRVVTIRAVALLACISALCLALVGCAGGGSASSSAASSGSASQASSAAASSTSAAASTDSASAAASSASAAPSVSAASASQSASAAAGATLTAADLSGEPSEVIALDDYEAMQALSKAIQNGEKEGAIVKIDGYVSNFAKGMSYNIVQKNAAGSGNIGTTFVIEDLEEDAYPSDGTHVVLTGKVVSNGAMGWNIHTLAEFVEAVA